MRVWVSFAYPHSSQRSGYVSLGALQSAVGCLDRLLGLRNSLGRLFLFLGAAEEATEEARPCFGLDGFELFCAAARSACAFSLLLR